MIRKLAVLTASLLACAGAAHAQHVHDVPARPALWAGADTNSANAYYMQGVQKITTDPRVSAAAFYWAERLNPGWADALYGRYVALLMTDTHRQVQYVDGSGGLDRNPEIRAIDSLYYRAVQRDPFLHPKLDKQYLVQYYRTSYRQAVKEATGEQDDALAEYAMNTDMAQAGDWFKAWMAFAEGRFPAAIDGYRDQLRHSRNPARLRLRLGQIQYLAGNYADAAQSLRQGIDELRTRDTRDVVRVYESKAVFEYSLASALEAAGKADSAREEYGKALQEDLSFWPGHRRMSALALAKNDTATAVAEMELAVEIAPNEPDLRYEHGVLLVQTGKVEEAAKEMEKAAELDPFYAEPHYVLAALHDASGMRDDAVKHYRAFLSLASRDDQYRAHAEERLAALGGPAQH